MFLGQLRDELMASHPPSALFVQGIAQSLAVYLVRNYTDTLARPLRLHRAGLSAFTLRKVTDLMEHQLAKGIELERLARAAGTECVSFLPAVQEGDRVLTIAVLHPDANVEGSPSAARDKPKHHRRRPGGGLQQPEPFRVRVPARGRRFPHGLSPIGRQSAVPSFGARVRQGEQGASRKTLRIHAIISPHRERLLIVRGYMVSKMKIHIPDHRSAMEGPQSSQGRGFMLPSRRQSYSSSPPGWAATAENLPRRRQVQQRTRAMARYRGAQDRRRSRS